MNLAVWWTNQGDCEAIDDAFEDGFPDVFPEYICDQYCDRHGRSGRGRLWVDEQFGDVNIDPWPKTALAKLLGDQYMNQTYAGIVIKAEDAQLFAEVPGIVTDLQLRKL